MNISRIIFSAIICLMLSSCALTNMANKYNTVNYTVIPATLETHAGNVALSIKGNFPEKYFAKQATIEITPYLLSTNDGQEIITPFKTVTIQGEEASGGESTIFYETGGDFTYNDKIKYNPNMQDNTLFLKANAKLKDEEKTLESIKIGDGVIGTSTRVLNNEDLANKNHSYEHETILEESATIYFLVNQSNIRTTEKSDEDIAKLTAFAKKRYKTHSIEIKSYASPEGSVNINDNISQERMRSTVKYTKRLLKSLKVNDADDDNLYTETSVGEDWEGFGTMINTSTIKDKRKINRIVSSVEDVELREQQIRDLSEIYDAIKDDVLPQLRKAEIIIRSFEPKRTDESIANPSTTYPDSLTLQELLFSATLTEDNRVKKEIFNSVIQLHNDWRGYNNLACIYINEDNISEAKNLLSKAKTIGGEQSDILINEGILASWDGSLKDAQTKFSKGNVSERNQAILDIRKGDYSKAARYFKNDRSHNAVLAQMLNGYKNVNCNENTAECHYLNAIIAARNNNNNNVITNLAKAINGNSKYKKEALLDLEFVKLRENESFISITE